MLYATSHGQTRTIAEELATRLRSHGHVVELADVASHPVPPTSCDAVILGSRVEMGKHARSIVRYIEANRDALTALPTAFFSVSNAAATSSAPDPMGYLERLFATVGWRPTRAIAFAGGLPYRKYGWLLRMIMKQINKRTGNPTDTSRDYVFTRWDEVERFADELSVDLAPQTKVEPAGAA